MRDDMIKEMCSDKLQLQEQVTRLEKLLRLLEEKDVKKVQQVRSGNPDQSSSG